MDRLSLGVVLSDSNALALATNIIKVCVQQARSRCIIFFHIKKKFNKLRHPSQTQRHIATGDTANAAMGTGAREGAGFQLA